MIEIPDDYISGLKGIQREIFERLHSFLTTYPGISPRMAFNVPFYYGRTWICYLNPKGNDAAELCFIKGYLLEDKKRIFKASGRKMVKGLIITNLEETDWEAIDEMMGLALKLDAAGTKAEAALRLKKTGGKVGPGSGKRKK